ncbi:hypothetical protein QYF36_005087 [Acer negundo]|nr:hypothetical protein QYF36_005087 [Acer negundo]
MFCLCLNFYMHQDETRFACIDTKLDSCAKVTSDNSCGLWRRVTGGGRGCGSLRRSDNSRRCAVVGIDSNGSSTAVSSSCQNDGRIPIVMVGHRWQRLWSPAVGHRWRWGRQQSPMVRYGPTVCGGSGQAGSLMSTSGVPRQCRWSTSTTAGRRWRSLAAARPVAECRLRWWVVGGNGCGLRQRVACGGGGSGSLQWSDANRRCAGRWRQPSLAPRSVTVVLVTGGNSGGLRQCAKRGGGCSLRRPGRRRHLSAIGVR